MSSVIIDVKPYWNLKTDDATSKIQLLFIDVKPYWNSKF